MSTIYKYYQFNLGRVIIRKKAQAPPSGLTLDRPLLGS
jgi:hypothetical protein